MTEDEMVGWHHRLNGHEFGWTLGVGDEQGGLVCCSSTKSNNEKSTHVDFSTHLLRNSPEPQKQTSIKSSLAISAIHVESHKTLYPLQTNYSGAQIQP